MLTNIKSKLKKNRFIVDTYRKLFGINGNKFLLGMTSIQERNFWEAYGKKSYQGEGEIVDLGCWLGSTTIPLGKYKVQAFDRFIWEDWMDPFVEHTFMKGKYQPGDDFKPSYEQIIYPYRKFVKVNKADLTKTKWSGAPIEFLLIDAMKSWELSNAIQENFYPYLVPGKSVIVHQDFSHYYTYWIHLMLYRQRDYFELVEDITGAGSTIFKLVKKIPDELLKPHSLADFKEDEIEKAFAYSLSISKPENIGAIMAARVMCYDELKGREYAKKELSKALATGAKHFDFGTVTGLFNNNSDNSSQDAI